MRIAMLAALALMTAAPSYALDLRGIRLGEKYDPKALEAKANGEHPDEIEPVRCDEKDIIGCDGHVQLGDVRVQMSIEASNGVVTKVTLSFDPLAFGILAQALREKFGKPTTSHVLGMQNGFGAQVRDHVLEWIDHDVEISTFEYVTLDEGMINLQAVPPAPTAPSL